jgi:hypothetical protein
MTKTCVCITLVFLVGCTPGTDVIYGSSIRLGGGLPSVSTMAAGRLGAQPAPEAPAASASPAPSAASSPRPGAVGGPDPSWRGSDWLVTALRLKIARSKKSATNALEPGGPAREQRADLERPASEPCRRVANQGTRTQRDWGR